MNLRSNRRIERHGKLIRFLVLHPTESKEAMEETGLPHPVFEMTNREEKRLLRSIKERLNGSSHS